MSDLQHEALHMSQKLILYSGGGGGGQQRGRKIFPGFRCKTHDFSENRLQHAVTVFPYSCHMHT
eukprot:753320-Hanusia_phi.AAC.3